MWFYVRHLNTVNVTSLGIKQSMVHRVIVTFGQNIGAFELFAMVTVTFSFIQTCHSWTIRMRALGFNFPHFLRTLCSFKRGRIPSGTSILILQILLWNLSLSQSHFFSQNIKISQGFTTNPERLQIIALI